MPAALRRRDRVARGVEKRRRRESPGGENGVAAFRAEGCRLPKNTESVIKRFKKVIVCELNSGQFATYLRSKVPGEYLQFNKVQGQPFTVAELEEHFESLLK